jgi:hypothetical protein
VEALVRAGLWEWIGDRGCERFELARTDTGRVLRGTILGLDADVPVEARYLVECDAAWRTVRADVTVRMDGADRTLALTVEDGRWRANGIEQPALAGCVDVDLEWSPSTNTLPLRRLDIPIGAASPELVMAWVRFPSLTVEPLPQVYRRDAARRFHYESGGGSFRTDIDVDDEGMVVRYEGGWQRVEPGSQARRAADRG